MGTPLTVRLDSEMERDLDELCAETGKSRSEIVREALRRQLMLLRFERHRRALIPYAEAAGYFTDEDVFRDIS